MATSEGDKKSLLITGGSRGIGLAAAKRFQSEGWRVVNLSRSSSPLEGVINISVDFASQGWERGSEEAIRGPLEGSSLISLVHNAGHLRNEGLEEVDSESLRRHLEVMVVAPAILSRIVLPLMRFGSSILYIGSTLSEKGVPNAFSYVAAKHAVVGAMRAACQDLHGRGIHTAAICPGFTATEMLLERLKGDPVLVNRIAMRMSEHRLIEPEEIASLIYYAATHSCINGSVLHAHLGQREE